MLPARRTGYRLAVGLIAFATLACSEPSEPSIRIEQASLWIGTSDQPPSGDASGWSPRPLPDSWSREERAVSSEGWYRARFEIGELPREPWAVLLPEVRMNAAVFVNGEAVGDGGRFDEPVARNWNRPLYFVVPPGLLRPGANVVDVRLVVSPSSEPRLAPLEVGPDHALRPAYDRRHFLQVTLRQLSVALILGMTGIIVFVAWRRPADRSSLWFAATFALAALGLLDGFVRDVPFSTRWWQWLNTTAYVGAVLCLLIGVHRLLRMGSRPLELLFAAMAVALCAFVGLASPAMFVTVSTGVLFLMTAAMVYVVVIVLRRRPEGAGWRVLGFGATLVLIGAHDILILPLDGPFGGVRWVGFIPLVIVTFSGWILLDYLLDALRDSEQLSAELDRRVAEKHGELDQTYERMRGLERERAQAGERERMVREMHDGVGGLLVSTLALVEGGESSPARVAEALRETLDEIRLMMDALDPASTDLTEVLANLRSRLAPRLARHGIEVEWLVSPGDAPQTLDPGAVHNVMRIAQEAIHNALRHSGARTIAVRTFSAPAGSAPGFVLEIADDGRGLTEPDDGLHRGIANMERRATEIGGRLEVVGETGGTIVRLWLPGSRSEAASEA